MIEWLSRCYTLKLICNGLAKQVSGGVAPCDKTSWRSYKLVSKCCFWFELRLQLWPGRLQRIILNRLIVLISDKGTRLTVTAPSETSFTKWCYCETRFYHERVRCNHSRSKKMFYFLQLKFKKVSRNLPSYTVQRLMKLVWQRRCA